MPSTGLPQSLTRIIPSVETITIPMSVQGAQEARIWQNSPMFTSILTNKSYKKKINLPNLISKIKSTISFYYS